MTKTVRVAIMPGNIWEYAVLEGITISKVLELAGLSAEGYDVKVDGAKVNPADATITSGTNLILLVKQLKGN